MKTASTWNDVQRRAAVSGSPILTKWKAEREAARGISNVTYSQDVMEAFGVNPSASGVSVNATSAMRVSAVAACVAKISGAIMSMPLHIYRLNGGDVPDRLPRDDLWYKLNEQPSAQYTAASMWEGVSMAQLLRGDAFALIRRGANNSIREILPLPWGSVSPVRDNASGVRYYVNLPSHGISTWYDASEILHFPGLGFDDSTMRSMSVIQYGARNAIGNAIAMDEYSGKFFEGGAHPSIVLSAANKMNADQITGLQNVFASKYAGLSNAHRLPLVLTEGITAKELSLSAEDAQLLEARKFQVLDVARAFGVPGFMINESTGSTSWGSGIESMGRGFVTYTLQPWLRKIEQEINRKLFPRDTGRFVEFYRDALIEGDSAAQGAYFRTALGGPGSGDAHMTVNEVRRIKRLAAVEGGDELYRAPRDKPSPDTGKQDAANADMANQFRELRNEIHMKNAQTAPANTTIHLSTNEIESTLKNSVDSIVQHTMDHMDKMSPIINVAAPVVNNVVNVPETVITVEAVMPEVAAPAVYNNNIINVEPSEVTVNLPARKTETNIVRDSSGNITKATQLETDA